MTISSQISDKIFAITRKTSLKDNKSSQKSQLTLLLCSKFMDYDYYCDYAVAATLVLSCCALVVAVAVFCSFRVLLTPPLLVPFPFAFAFDDDFCIAADGL